MSKILKEKDMARKMCIIGEYIMLKGGLDNIKEINEFDNIKLVKLGQIGKIISEEFHFKMWVNYVLNKIELVIFDELSDKYAQFIKIDSEEELSARNAELLNIISKIKVPNEYLWKLNDF